MRNIEELKSPSQSNLSSEKLLSVLETMSELDEPIRLQELSRKLEMNSSTVLRFLTTLQKKNYVAQEVETDRYYLTYKICILADNLLTNGSIRAIALPSMKKVSRSFGETVSLMIENDMSAVCLESVNCSNSSLKCSKPVGSIEPLHCSAAGKLLLTQYDEEKWRLLMLKKGLADLTANTITDPEKVQKEVADIAESMVAYDNEESEYGIRSVAAPVYNHAGKIAALICVTGPSNRMTDELIQANLDLLKEAAAEVSTRLGLNALDKEEVV